VKNLSRIFSYVRPYWGLMLSSVGIILVGTAFGLASPWPMKVLFDNVLGAHEMPAWLARLFGTTPQSKVHLLFAIAGVSLFIVLVENLLGVLNNYVTTKLQQYMVLDFRSDLFQHAQRLSLAFHDQRRSGPLIYAINFQADAAASIALAFAPILESLLIVVGMFGIIFVMDRRLALLSLAVLPFLYISVGFYAKHIEGRIRRVKEMEEVSLSIIHEAISMLRVIVAFGREGHEYQRFRKQGRTAVDARVNLTIRQTLFSLIIKLITGIGIAMVIAF
jgi:ATP-binding cassette, subfamily B, bacterial